MSLPTLASPAAESDEFWEEAIQCVLRFRYDGGSAKQCPHDSIFDAITECAEGHIDTKFLCDDSCMQLAINGGVDCRECKANGGVDCRECKANGVPAKQCPVRVLTYWRRVPFNGPEA